MKALTFDYNLPRCALAKLLGMVYPPAHLCSLGPVQYKQVPDPQLQNDDWVIVQTHYAGICGSDLRQVFLDGTADNPLTAMISFPHVMGHEAAGTIVECGSNVSELKTGDRVAIYPWLHCEARSLPPCSACEISHYPCCENVADTTLGVGMHLGTSAKIFGSFAPKIAVHKSMCFPVPDNVRLDHAAMADPFAVALRAVHQAEPKPGQTIMVFGGGSLGAWVVQILSRYFPDVRILAVDIHEHIGQWLQDLGASTFYARRGTELIEAVARDTHAQIRYPSAAPPWLFGSDPQVGVHTIIDTVGSNGTLETGLRIVKPEGRIVHVALARRATAEWTPFNFKEVTIVGSNGCGIQSIEGERQHAFRFYLDALADEKLDASRMITHCFALQDYRQAFLAARNKQQYKSLKVMFDFTEERSA